MVTLHSVLDRCLLRQPQKKIGKIITGAGNRGAVHNFRRIEAGKNKRSARIPRALGVGLNSAEVSAPSPGMFAMVPNHVVRPGKSLVPQQLRVGVLDTGKVGEGK